MHYIQYILNPQINIPPKKKIYYQQRAVSPELRNKPPFMDPFLHSHMHQLHTLYNPKGQRTHTYIYEKKKLIDLKIISLAEMNFLDRK